MAITILDTPACADAKSYTPLHNELVFVVTSTNNEALNFRYVYEIKTGSGGVLATIRQFPNPSGLGVIDVHRILQSFALLDIQASDAGVIASNSSIYSWKVSFGEEYGDPVDTTLALTTSSVYYGWSATIPHLDYIGFSSSNYIAANITVSPLTTETTFRIRRGAGAWLYTLADTSNNVSFLRVKTYSVDGTLLGNYKINNTHTPVSGNSNRHLRVPVGPRNIALIPSGSITVDSGSLPIITASVDRYTAWFESSSTAYSWDLSSIADASGNLVTPLSTSAVITIGSYEAYPTPPSAYGTLSDIVDYLNNPLSDDMQPLLTAGSSPFIGGAAALGTITIVDGGTTYTFPMGSAAQLTRTVTYKVMDNVCRYPLHNLVFKNQRGGFDSVQITQAPHNSSSTKRDTFQMVTGSVVSNQWSYTAKERGQTVFHSLSTKKVKGSTTYLTDAEWIWIEQLIQSPEVYEEMQVNGTWSLVPVVILTNDYENKYAKSDGIQMLTVEYQYAHKQNPVF